MAALVCCCALGCSLVATRATVAGPGPGLVRRIDTSAFATPSPDPTGIVYLPDSGTLLISDSEVNETDLYTGANLFEASLSGAFLRSASTAEYSGEPTGIARDPLHGRLFISDDNDDMIVEVRPGADGTLLTEDDEVVTIDTRLFGGTDPEDVAFDAVTRRLVIVDGIDSTIFTLSFGDNGVLDGVPPAGDDSVTSFETEELGVSDPEGAAIDPDTGHLFIVGQPPTVAIEVTDSGSLVRVLDISVANAVKPSSAVFAPGSVDPQAMNLYVTDRGLDNADDPDENDGLIYELSVPLLPGNFAPRVDIGPDRTVELPASLELLADVVDDGVPNAEEPVDIRWSQLSGVGTVTFDDAHSLQTTASFSLAGEYVLRLSAFDGDLTGRDELTVTVTGTRGERVTEARIATGDDDAEERTTGVVTLQSTDLEMVFDRGGNQTIGLRFSDVDVPRRSSISNAYIQFSSDDDSELPAELTLHGIAADNAQTFTRTDFDVSSRPRTTASVLWTPRSWRDHDAGVDQRSANVASILEEVVSRPGWRSGNAFGAVITGSGQRVAASYNDSPETAPFLHVEYFPPPADGTVFRRGDANGDSTVDVSDPVHVLVFLFFDSVVPTCLLAADFNDDIEINVSDAIYGLTFLFHGGAAPPLPFPECGFDPTPDGEPGCVSSSCDGA